MGLNNNGAVPRMACVSSMHLFLVLSLTGIGAFTAATTYLGVSTPATSHARNMIASAAISGGATKPTPSTIHQANGTEPQPHWNETFGTAAFAAASGRVKQNKPGAVTPRPASTICTELTAETVAETGTYEEEQLLDLPLPHHAFGEAIAGKVRDVRITCICIENVRPSLTCDNFCLYQQKGGPLKVLFLSADTGGGHRASAESLANQVIRSRVSFSVFRAKSL